MAPTDARSAGAICVAVTGWQAYNGNVNLLRIWDSKVSVSLNRNPILSFVYGRRFLPLDSKACRCSAGWRRRRRRAADPLAQPAVFSRDDLGCHGLPPGGWCGGERGGYASNNGCCSCCEPSSSSSWSPPSPSPTCNGVPAPIFSPHGNTHRVLVIDSSYSMAYKTAGLSRFEQAKQWAARIVEQSSPGDGVLPSVIMAAPPRAIVATPGLETGPILDEIRNLPLLHSAADLPANADRGPQAAGTPPAAKARA